MRPAARRHRDRHSGEATMKAAAVLMLGSVLFGFPADSDAQTPSSGATPSGAGLSVEQFYRGRNVSLLVANVPGGRYDLNARLIARHLGRFIPGHPTIVVQNITGGGGLVLANRLYNTSERDGSVLAVMQPGIPQVAIQGHPNAKFNPLEFNWFGSLSSFGDDSDLLIVSPQHSAYAAVDLRGPGQSATVGAGTPGSTNTTFSLIARDVLGLNLKIVRGYPTAPYLAMERGEIDGQIVLMSSIKTTQPTLWSSKHFRALLQFGRLTRHPEQPNVPTAREMTDDEDDLALIEFAELSFFMSLPLAAPPGLPPDRAEALKQAFAAMTRSPAFRQDAAAMQIDFSPIDGAAVADLVRRAAATPRAVIDEYNKIVPPGN
jgi:tripartite-type tricarboxylate transporter receptor subunit TctC